MVVRVHVDLGLVERGSQVFFLLRNSWRDVSLRKERNEYIWGFILFR